MLKDIIASFIPYNEQEAIDKEFFLKAMSDFKNYLSRENEYCHFVSTAFIINKEHTKILCVFHNIYKSWCWVGGHADNDDDLRYVAMKEANEETSIINLKQLIDEPISIESLPVSSHLRKGKLVHAHTHLNVTYLFEADENESIQKLSSENSNVGWLTFNELLNKTIELQMLPVYKKIIEKINLLDN